MAQGSWASEKDGSVVKPTIKTFPLLSALTESEALVFDESATLLKLAAGSEVSVVDSLLLIHDGAVGLSVESGGSIRSLGTLERGGLLGEMNLFEPDPAGIRAKAERDTRCLSWTIPDIKNAFRYSRTGASKLMAVLSMGLSGKIRLANELLRMSHPAAASPGARPRELGELDLRRLRSFSVTRDYDAGTVLFEEGEHGKELFVIAAGKVDILKETDAGTKMTLDRLEAGDFFGEMAFVDGSPRSASAVAQTSLRLHVLSPNSLERAFQHNVATGLYFTNVLCKIMSRRLAATLRRIASI